MKVRTIHPFPARMAPDLALTTLANLPACSIVLDPMMGSGTVVRQALEFGHDAVGYDLDPLAVLMSKAWTTEVLDDDIEVMLREVLSMVDGMGGTVPLLEWQSDPETSQFIDFWFHEVQRAELSRISSALDQQGRLELTPGRQAALDVLRVAFSRIIITKEQGASLARDTSHSRPHRVSLVSDYRVRFHFERSVTQLRKRLLEHPPKGGARVSQGDARALALSDESVDAVITSPPYLNAIDYMRGHRMSLTWLGHSIPALRSVRSNSIGAERSADAHDRYEEVTAIARAMRGPEPLDKRLEGIIGRYALDLINMTAEISRVLKPGCRATFVVGNSCIKGAFIDNALGVATAASRGGMALIESRERDLPAASRYLPISGEALSKRMRTETVLICEKPLANRQA
jgi:hypothetical protein